MKLISQKKAMEITGLSRYDIDCLAKAGRLNYFKLPVGSSKTRVGVVADGLRMK